jgi:hypothetical protein
MMAVALQTRANAPAPARSVQARDAGDECRCPQCAAHDAGDTAFRSPREQAPDIAPAHPGYGPDTRPRPYHLGRMAVLGRHT